MGSTSIIINRRTRLSWTLMQTIVSQQMQLRFRSTPTLTACTSASNRLRERELLPRPVDHFCSSAGDRILERKAQWQSAWLFAAAGVMAFSTTKQEKAFNATEKQEVYDKSSKKLKVVFVLGGPGSGKGTQCAKIVDSYGFVHLSAGDLLRAEIKSGSANGNMIQGMIKEGKIVPSEVTVKLLQKAMNESSKDKFLIDGFPRNEENRAAFEEVTGISPEFILFFDCPEAELEKRLLGRNEGRVDDNIETIRKRFKVFIESSVPVIEHYESVGKVRKINATEAKDEVFSAVQPLFKPYLNTSATQD